MRTLLAIGLLLLQSTSFAAQPANCADLEQEREVANGILYNATQLTHLVQLRAPTTDPVEAAELRKAKIDANDQIRHSRKALERIEIAMKTCQN